MPAFASLDDLNGCLLECCVHDRERRIEGRYGTVGEAFRLEQPALKPRPAEHFDLGECLKCSVDANGCVRVKHNRYSTPLRPGSGAEVRLDASHVEVRWQGSLVARHPRCYLVQQELLVLDHYLGVLDRKPGALAHSKALAQYRQAGLWPESFDRLWEKLIERHGQGTGTREMIRLLRMVPVHGTQRLRSAIESALACGSSDAGTVLHLLTPATQAAHTAAPLAGSGAAYELPVPKLDIYDQLLGGSTAEVRQ